jgi:hypothetical protein
MPAAADAIAAKAIDLAGSVAPGDESLDGAVGQLVAAGDRQELQQGRQALVERIFRNSDDYQATAALNLVNRALAASGWDDPYSWKHRRKP